MRDRLVRTKIESQEQAVAALVASDHQPSELLVHSPEQPVQGQREEDGHHPGE